MRSPVPIRHGALAAVFFACLVGNAAAQEPTPSASPAPATIPVPEISTRAGEVTIQLREFEASLQPDADIQAIEQGLQKVAAAIDEQGPRATQTLHAQPPLDTIESLAKPWLEYAADLGPWKDTLSQRALRSETTVAAIDEILAAWKFTEQNLAADTPDVTKERVRTTISAIEGTRKIAKQERDAILTLQDAAGAELAHVEEVLGLVERARMLRVQNLFSRDAPAIWQLPLEVSSSTDAGVGLRGLLGAQVRRAVEYAKVRGGTMSLHLVGILLLALLLFRARRQLRGTKEADQQGVDLKILERPGSVALLLGLGLAPWIEDKAPRVVDNLLSLIALLPVLRLATRLIDRALHPWLYALGAFFVIDRIRSMIATAPMVEQLLFLGEMLGGAVFLIALVSPGRLARIAGEIGGGSLRLVRGAAPPLLLLFAAAFVASALGFGQLGRLLGGGALTSLYLAITIYAALRATEGVVGYALTTYPMRELGIVKRHGILVYSRIQRGLRWLALLGWIVSSLSAFTVLDDLQRWLAGGLAASFSRGTLTISIGDVVAFGLTVWFSFAFSRFVRFALEEDVYPRLNVSSGLPYALSRLVHYFLITAGFFAATAMIGLDTDRLAFLVGAFGVGIGFGLQNVVNNFVSGIILLFERPVQVGDSVQLGSLTGRVERIGIRSSTLRTFTGAEVIVPNANLISEQLTNWTHSDRTRLVQLPIGVAYDTDLTKARQLLVDIARQHPDVLADPPPQALFTGFGDSAINLELRMWTGNSDNWVALRSDVGLLIHVLFRQAEIEIPFPQRVVSLAASKDT